MLLRKGLSYMSGDNYASMYLPHTYKTLERASRLGIKVTLLLLFLVGSLRNILSRCMYKVPGVWNVVLVEC